MGSFNRPHAFDPLDMEIIDLVYEVAWEQISARKPSHDTVDDEERQASLRKRVFALAGNGGVDFDTLLDRVLASLPEPLRQTPTDTRLRLGTHRRIQKKADRSRRLTRSSPIRALCC